MRWSDACLETSCSTLRTSLRRGRLGSTHRRRRSGRGWSRWDRGAPAPTPMTLIENLFGLNMHSADRIVPEWQQLEVGDVLRNQEGRPGMRVEILTPERGLAN